MRYEVYNNLTVADDLSILEFFSIGTRGVLLKRIIFVPTEQLNLVSLIFGDIDKNGDLDIFSISGNGDRNKILGTVFQAIELYLKKYPYRSIYFKGSTIERTRLYRMIINSNIKYLESMFDILIKVSDDFLPFQSNKAAIGFLIKCKTK
ncbi:hypothetical protein DVR12_02470 [Chitinophaga silvatica]|uniref:Uncharacterized protein n=1 Tax=Chitinophaga silvatica TaxID=2282649 RepID=A0A3E1YH44_9BACT|nr:hypothetical protein [Chitinophaga silvatica]RFS26674.1 hypothetical protein DVR12_02470 [Chitinophaga silvatica]